MFTFSKGLCVFVYVCLCACAYLWVYIIHVDIFPQWKRYSFIFKTCFWITFWCRDCAGERIESAKTIPPCPLKLHCSGETARNKISTQIYVTLWLWMCSYGGMWSGQQVQARFSWESAFELTCWRYLAVKNFVFIFHSKELETLPIHFWFNIDKHVENIYW